MDETRRQIFAFVAVAGSLKHITFGAPMETPGRNALEEEEDFFMVKKSQDKQGNTVRARRNTVIVDPRLFAAIDYDIPTSPGELSTTEIRLFHALGQLLKVDKSHVSFFKAWLTFINHL